MAADAAADFIENLVANLVENAERLMSIARSAGRRILDRVFAEASYIDNKLSFLSR